MRDLLVGLIGVVGAVAATSALDLNVHLGPYLVSGWLRYGVAAVGRAFCAILIWRTLRAKLGV